MPKKTLPKAKRLMRGKSWIASYDGQHIIKGYRKHFGVDRLTAIRDLTELGVIDTVASRRLQNMEAERIEQVRKHRAEQKAIAAQQMHQDQNDRFFFIAGYTSGGVPYGITWEEMGLQPWEEID